MKSVWNENRTVGNTDLRLKRLKSVESNRALYILILQTNTLRVVRNIIF